MGARQLQCKMRKMNWKGSSTSGVTLRGVAQGRAVMKAERRWDAQTTDVRHRGGPGKLYVLATRASCAVITNGVFSVSGQNLSYLPLHPTGKQGHCARGVGRL